MRRGATAWPSTHRNVFEEAMDKLREALEEVQLTEEELRRQNEELAAAQLEAVIARERYAELFNFAPAAHLVTDLGATPSRTRCCGSARRHQGTTSPSSS